MQLMWYNSFTIEINVELTYHIKDIMNIVYLLTNKSKTEGKRFYVGSKIECKLIKLDGVDTIYNVKTDKPYYSSSSNYEFAEDMKAGHVFEASILEVVIGREKLRDAETKHIRLLNAVDSPDFYNMAEAFQNTYDHQATKNMFGETVAEYASRASQVSKRDGTAKALGYNNFGEMYFALQKRLDNGESVSEVSSSCGKHRKWIQITLSPYDMVKAKMDLGIDRSTDIREFMRKGASLKYAAESLNIELPAARVMLGDYSKAGERAYSVASARGKSKEELEIEITNRVLDGEGFIEIGNSMALVRESVLRYFLRCLRANKEAIKNLLGTQPSFAG